MVLPSHVVVLPSVSCAPPINRLVEPAPIVAFPELATVVVVMSPPLQAKPPTLAVTVLTPSIVPEDSVSEPLVECAPLNFAVPPFTLRFALPLVPLNVVV